MRQVFVALVVLGALLVQTHAARRLEADEVPKYLSRHAYKHSFKKPFVLPDTNEFPHFDVYGDVILSDDYVRIAPSTSSRRGAIWNDVPFDLTNWEIEAELAISSRGRIGGDGLAFWLTKSRGTTGPIFGNLDKWDGLGIIFDTYDNDNRRNNPIIMGVLNDGTMEFDYDADGFSQEFGKCLKNYRNAPVPTRIKIIYVNQNLSVYVDVNGRGGDYRLCFTGEGIALPKGYYLGISAGTGAVADDHDVMYFEVRELFPDKAPGDLGIDATPEQQAAYEDVADRVHSELDNNDDFALDDNYKNTFADDSRLIGLSDKLDELIRVISSAPAGSGSGKPSDALALNAVKNDVLAVRHDIGNLAAKLEHFEKGIETLLSRNVGGGSEGSGVPVAALLSQVESRVAQVVQRLSTIESIVQNSRSMAQNVRDDVKSMSSSGTVSLEIVAVCFAILLAIFGAIVFFLQKKNNDSKKWV